MTVLITYSNALGCSCGAQEGQSEEEEEEQYQFLEKLAILAYDVNPGLPVPLRMEESGEMAIYTEDAQKDAPSVEDEEVNDGFLSVDGDCG